MWKYSWGSEVEAKGSLSGSGALLHDGCLGAGEETLGHDELAGLSSDGQ